MKLRDVATVKAVFNPSTGVYKEFDTPTTIQEANKVNMQKKRPDFGWKEPEITPVPEDRITKDNEPEITPVPEDRTTKDNETPKTETRGFFILLIVSAAVIAFNLSK